MRVFAKINEMRAWRGGLDKNERLAFVPTMGNLHEGHFSLVREAQASAKKVVVSIFVNKLQFAPGEDFSAYPRTFDDDCQKLRNIGVDAVFFPSDKELFPSRVQSFYVEPPDIQNDLCGAFRPGHFRGVATIVTKLFNIVSPDIAVFGRKDYQQLHIIKGLIDEMNLPIQIVSVNISREEDGLARSSRNIYLSDEDRKKAPALFFQLNKLKLDVLRGNRDYILQTSKACVELQNDGWQVDYIDIRDAETLAKADAKTTNLIALGAARLGNTRLIDNLDINLSL